MHTNIEPDMTKIVYLLITTSMCLTPLLASSFYVSSNAKITGTGSFSNPWTFQTALNHPSALHPGDTVWLKGGIYTNTYDAQTSFNCKTNGTANAPIIFRNYNNERVTIDGQLLYSLYVGLGNSSYTWFWGLEITNTASTDRNHDIPGGITCTAENIKFINMIIHDTGTGIDCWKTAKNSETYGCIIYHIGNNLLNGTNLEGHGHGMYLQNDTFGTKLIHNNIIFNTYGYGIKVWQTTTTAALGNFDIQRNIVFNSGAASENLGGVGNNSRTHNFFVVANGENNPVRNTVIKHNYTYADQTMPRPSVNAFGLNYGVLNMTLDSNVLMCQTRLGHNNTPIFDASVKGNQIIGGIPPVYGIYLWGFTQADYPQNNFIPIVPTSGLSYFVLPNKYESDRSHIVIYNWDNSNSVTVNITNTGLQNGDQYELINTLDYYNDVITKTYDGSGTITIPMIGHTAVQAIGSKQKPIISFPTFGAFLLRKSGHIPTNTNKNSATKIISILPNPSHGKFTISNIKNIHEIFFFNVLGELKYKIINPTYQTSINIDLTFLSKGIYFLQTKNGNDLHIDKVIIE
ncbi:MAG: T9SS type A sorting domain-containing protein [Saprospiraceae bacterium]|nr:T9SS type A sorting domain-containing protein [Candidatus Defluviibacterium haderslevense]